MNNGTQSKAVLTELIRRMCRKPESLDVQFTETRDVVRVSVVAHPNDARIIVGTRRAHLNAIEQIAFLLWSDSRKLVQFLPVASTDEKEIVYRSMQPDKNWPEKELVDFALHLTKAVFPQAEVAVTSIFENSAANRFEVYIKPSQNSETCRRFSRAIAVLFMPIGSAVGRAIFADVKR